MKTTLKRWEKYVFKVANWINVHFNPSLKWKQLILFEGWKFSHTKSWLLSGFSLSQPSKSRGSFVWGEILPGNRFLVENRIDVSSITQSQVWHWTGTFAHFLLHHDRKFTTFSPDFPTRFEKNVKSKKKRRKRKRRKRSFISFDDKSE